MNPFDDFLRFNPMVEMGAYREAMRQLIEEGWAPSDLSPSAVASVLVPVDVMDVGPDIVVQANMPGVNPETVSITLAADTLTIKGKVKTEEEYQDAIYLRRERRASAFTRSLSLPVEVDADKAEAVFQDGVLTLTLPKSEAIRPKTIKIKSA